MVDLLTNHLPKYNVYRFCPIAIPLFPLSVPVSVLRYTPTCSLLSTNYSIQCLYEAKILYKNNYSTLNDVNMLCKKYPDTS